jgi:hypothetical protein
MSSKISNTEIEIRGALHSRTSAQKLITKIQEQAKAIIQENKQIVIFYKENDQDFRIKWDKGKKYFEFVHKTQQGTQRTTRDEFIVTIDKKQVNDFFKILEELGLKKGFVSSTHRMDIITTFIIWSFKLGSVIGDYWEAEATKKLIQKYGGNKDKIKSYLEEKASSLGLTFWNEEEFKRIRQEKWAKVQPIVNSKIVKLLQHERY